MVGTDLKESRPQRYFEPLCTARHLSVRFYDWEPSRYVGDITHLLAVGLCVICLLREEGTQGVSLKAHILYFLVFTARFSNVFFCDQTIYSIIYKLVLWQGTLVILLIMVVRTGNTDPRDTLPLIALLIMTMIVTVVFGGFSAADNGLVAEILWIFSNYLEGLAMLPQYIYCYKDAMNLDHRVLAYLLAMGGYQMIFGLHWIALVLVSDGYLDLSSFVNGFLGVALFADFIVFKLRNQSPCSILCLAMDLHLHDAQDSMSSALGDVRGQMSSGVGVIDIVRHPVSQSGTPSCTPLGKSSFARQEVEFHSSDFHSSDDEVTRQVSLAAS